jgi:hypothetical protein
LRGGRFKVGGKPTAFWQRRLVHHANVKRYRIIGGQWHRRPHPFVYPSAPVTERKRSDLGMLAVSSYTPASISIRSALGSGMCRSIPPTSTQRPTLPQRGVRWRRWREAIRERRREDGRGSRMSWPSYVTCNLPICGAGRVDLVDARHRFGSAPHIGVRHIHCVMCSST